MIGVKGYALISNFNTKETSTQKNSGNKSLGHIGRVSLRKTLLNAQNDHNNVRVNGKFSSKFSNKNMTYKAYPLTSYRLISGFVKNTQYR